MPITQLAKGNSVENNYEWKSKPMQLAQVDDMLAHINTDFDEVERKDTTEPSVDKSNET